MARSRWPHRDSSHGSSPRAARRPVLAVLTAALVAATVLVAATGDARQASGPRIDLKVLLVTADQSDSSFEAWAALLDREQVPYDVRDASGGGSLTETDLRNGDHSFYQAVVCSTECSEILTSAELAVLDAFQADFGIRRVNAYAVPRAAYGLTSPTFSGFLSGEIGSTTTAGASVFPYLVGPVPMDEWTWGYAATPLPGSGHTTLVEGPGGTSWIGVIGNPAGFEEMVVAVETSAEGFHSLLLGHGQLTWATRGVYLGYTRNYYSAHFDDIFLSSDRWDVADNTTYPDGGATNPLIRMTAADADRLKAWTLETGVRLDMAFNGEGSDRVVAAEGTDPLKDSLLAGQDLFAWLNHTYAHADFDAADADEVRTEIQLNLDFAAANGIPIDPTELVTGRHSGLDNPAVHTVFGELGIEWAAGQASATPEPIPAGPATIVPRHGSSLFYNIGTAAEMLDQFNYITFENCDPARRRCRTSPATWNQIVGWEAEIMLIHMLGNQPEPHFMHQGNLAEDGTFYLVFDPALEQYRAHVTVDLVQPLMSEAGRYLLRANAWEAARPNVVAYLQDGSIHLTSPTAVQAPVTGLPGGEDYDGLPSGWVDLAPGVELVIPLEPPVDVTPPVITILGANPLELLVGDPYTDPGVTAHDDIDGDLTASVFTDLSGLDTTIPGTYTITYTVADTAGNITDATRTVVVTADPTDVTPPVITILGANPLELLVGDPYLDPGVTAHDDVDGDLTASVFTDLSGLDTAIPGAYTVTYTVADAAGNITDATRTVQVTEAPIDVTPPVITVFGANPLTHPVDTPYLDPGVTAHDDVDGDLTASVFTDLSGLDTTIPGTYTITYTVADTAGNIATATRTVEVIADPVTGTIEVRIAASSDDAEERADGILELRSSDLEITEENTLQAIGLRFADLQVPRGARITGAWIRFTVDEPTGRSTSLVFAAHDTADAPTFGGRFDIRTRPLTAATVAWNPGRWVAAGDSGPAQQTPDLSPIIQAIIDRSDWAPGAAIALVVEGTGKRVAETHDADPDQAPLLHIQYETGPIENTAPVVTASGSGTAAPGDATLIGTITDDGLPDPPAAVGVLWEQTAGPAVATIADAAAASTSVFLPQPGEYTFSLTADDTELTGSATVTITATEPVVDVTPPVITVLGADPVEVPLGGPYVDPGATAIDDVDGDLTAAIVTDSSALDLATAGIYTVTYTVADAAGNTATAARSVEVSGVPPTGGTIEVRIASGGDDVEERGDGTLEIGSGDLEITEENTLQVVGLRFIGIDIPRGAQITAAWIQFTVDEPTGRPTSLVIGVHDIGDAPAFGGHGDLRSRLQAATTAGWNPARWVAAGDSTAAQRSPDLSAVIAQLIDRPDWSPGAAIALIIEGTGKRVAHSYNAGPTLAPLLHIEYTVPPQ